MSTIQDVARHAAVSASTVSNVLNGRTEKMRQETLARVEEAIVALKYRPSTLARQLKTGQTPLLGLLVPSIANPMYGYIAREVETFAQEKYGHRVLIGNTYRDKEKEASFFEDLLAHGVRRVIVISSLADESHLTQAVQRARHPASPFACGKKPRPSRCRPTIRPKSSKPTCRRYCSPACFGAKAIRPNCRSSMRLRQQRCKKHGSGWRPWARSTAMAASPITVGQSPLCRWSRGSRTC